MTSNPPVVTAEQRREGDEQRIYLRSLRKELKKYKTNVYFGGIGSGLSY